MIDFGILLKLKLRLSLAIKANGFVFKQITLLKYYVLPDQANAAMNNHGDTTKENCSKTIPIASC